MFFIDLTDSQKAIWKGGFTTLFVITQLSTINNYVVIFLNQDLFTAVAIITIIVSLRNFLQIFLRVPLGELSQIVGRKPLILGGHLSFTISLVFLYLAQDWVLVLFAILCTAFGMSCFWASLFSYVADVAPQSVGESTGQIFMATDVGSLLSGFLSAFLLNELGWNLTGLFGFMAILGIATGIIGVILLPEGLDPSQRKRVDSVFSALSSSFQTMIIDIKRISFSYRLEVVYVFQLVLAFTEFALTTFLPMLIVSKGFTEGDVGGIVFWATLVIVWFKPFLGRLSDNHQFTLVFAIPLFVISGIILMFTYIYEYILLVVLYILMNGALITAYSATNSEVTRRAPFEQRGIAMGVLGFWISVGRTVSTLLLGIIWEFFGLISVFLSMVIICFGGTGIVLLIFRDSSKPQIQNEISERL
ncbi:MAG: MFS transporter [Candidatus Heimdallarchaeota archaeon]